MLVAPHRELYAKISHQMNEIFLRYTDLVEPASIDESYLDLTGSLHLFGGDAKAVADRIRAEVRKEAGITVSVGVSFCKTFAKLGSDYKNRTPPPSFPAHGWRNWSGRCRWVPCSMWAADLSGSSGSWAFTPSAIWPGAMKDCSEKIWYPGRVRMALCQRGRA